MADEEILDSHCFLTLFNQRLFDEIVSRKKIIPEVGFNLSDGTYPEIDVQIKRRGWRRLASPQDEVAKAMAAKVRMNREYGGYEHIDQGRLITNEVMETIRIPQITLGQHVEQGNIDEPMPQFVPPHEPHNAADGAEFGDQEPNLDHQYEHHWEQPPYVEPIPQLEQPPPQYNYQQQPQYVTYENFQQFQQSQLDQMQSYQQSQTQLMQQYHQSQAEMMQQYQQKQLEAQQQGFQKLNEQVANMQIEIQNELGQYKEELSTLKGKQQESFVNTNNMCNRILREQKRMNKELIDLKKWQVSETVGRNEQSNKIMEAWNEQRGYMEGMSKQMKNWTRNASARECYDIWAHQQLNPNLVEILVTKLVRLIYDNCDKKRPAFLGCLKSDHEAGTSSQAAPPATPTAAPTSAATATTTPTPALAQQHDQDDYYPEQFFQK
ncbi:hypothetical protein PIB30_087833 [Stylosanthes scabra]|uniref:Uncharacterized protein n=1 Tax=Stylosanthes scabra TaxID=79078 RepID=A0ABU6RUU6_9FABA|nr:hypothetical protein [Stylosanthes scabra]